MTFDRAQLVAAAEVDPWALLAQLNGGDPSEIERLAAAFYRASGDTADATASDAKAKQYVRQGYQVNGGAPLDLSSEVKATSTSLTDAADKLPKIAKALASVADDLASATQSVTALTRGVEDELNLIEQKYTTFMQGVGHHLPPDDQQAARNGYFNEAVDKVRSYGTSAQGVVMDYEHTLAGATRTLSDLGYVAPVGLREAGEIETAPLPVGTDPVKVAAWWAGLSPAQQEYLLDHEYDTLGQLKGLPAPVLDTSNRHRISDDKTSLQMQLTNLNAHPEQDPFGARRAALQSRLDDDNGILAEIDKPGPGNPPTQTYVLAFDPHGKQGQTGVAISYGNPDTADNTAVVVPGTGNDASKLTSVGSNGRELYNNMTGNRAVVVWLDGPEPPELTNAAFDSYANDSAPHLVTDIAGLRAAHSAATGQDGHLTAIGHSYGSYILGKAATQGAKVDDVVFVGSPGVGVNHARDLGLDPSHVWDGEAGDDPILFTEKRFTPNPLTGNNPEDSDFGAQHFDVTGSHGHSEYYKKGSESVHNMARIADGDYAAVDRVPAPDYRGPRELFGDALSSVLDQPAAQVDAAKDLLTGHPIDAGQDLVNGTVNEGKDLLHTGEDVLESGKDVIDAGTSWLSDHL
jgi:Alpha/beta hydrolase